MQIQKTHFENFDWWDIVDVNREELRNLSFPFEIDENFIEDALEVGHLPKIEKVTGYQFIILRYYNEGHDPFKDIDVGEISNKIAFIISEDLLVTIHRAECKALLKVDSHYESVDLLAFDIFNSILMSYFLPLEEQGENMDSFEKQIFLGDDHTLSIKSLYFEKSRARLIKKILDITQNVFQHYSLHALQEETSLRDLKDTTLNLTLLAEEIIDDANALFHTHMSFSAQKSNEVMKLLTIFSAFFLPLTFIAGIYGMNFKNIPELEWEYGYYAVLILMVIISLLTFRWFRNKKII